MDQEINLKKEEMDFLYDEDVIPSLEKLGLKELFLQGGLTCHFCNKVITEDNLSAFFLEGDTPRVSCDAEDCVTKAAQQ